MDRAVDGCPLDEQLLEGGGAGGREAVEALVALVLFTPFTDQQALGFEAAQERVEGALFNVDAVIGEGFAQGIAVVLLAELGQDGEDEAAAAELEAEVFKNRLDGFGHTVLYTLYDAQYMPSSSFTNFSRWPTGRESLECVE